ncbi:MAG: F0F1 ATP synthase subunit delta, partial [Gammaproteobacteria bacterium]
TRLGRRADVAYVLPFENRGAEVGVTLHHPHGQIYAYPVVPPVPARMLEMALRHYEAHGRGALETLIAAERGEITAEVTSARPLSAEQTEALKETLKASVGKDVKLDVTVDESLILYLFGTPGQSRFWFMWDELARGSVGAVVLVDLRRVDDCFPAVDYFENRGLPFVVAV